MAMVDCPILTGKQRMLNAYRGISNDRPAIAPEFWYYYPAKMLGVDMIEFERNVAFHLALKTAFAKFNCEGWGIAFCGIPNDRITVQTTERWIDDSTLEIRHVTHTPLGDLTSAHRSQRDEPGWTLERPIKDPIRDLAAWELTALGGNLSNMDFSSMVKAREEVGESYLLEAWLGVPFFDFYAGSREGGFEAGIFDFTDPDIKPILESLRARYTEHLVEKARQICIGTPFESLCIGCSWSCNSLIGPDMWRYWDKPVIQAVCNEIHRQGRLLHVHFHGKCMETVADFAEMGIDCVCPFERPPGGDVKGQEDLRTVARLLQGRTTMNGNVHTVETLIRASPNDVRREVREILAAFKDNPRLIVGTGDQVGRETPEENLYALIDEAKAAHSL
jgi:hypothetical protein